MTRIFFYHGAADRLAAISDLLAKAAAKDKPVLVYVPDDALATELDRYLWVHPPTGFVPHCFADSSLATQTPVVLTRTLDDPIQDERLMNLGEAVPPIFSRFTSLIEVVDDAGRERGRERARFYKDRGYELTFIDLGGRA